MKLLLTGFEPFLENKTNPTMAVIDYFKKEENGSELRENKIEFETLILPVLFEEAYQVLETVKKSFLPDLVLHLGLSNKSEEVHLEKLAVNWRSAKNSDNSGEKITAGKIIEIESENPKGPLPPPTALETLWPIENLLEHFQKENQPVEISYSAGLYVCNDLYYRSLFDEGRKTSRSKTLFVHIPEVSKVPLPKTCEIVKNTILRSHAYFVDSL